MHNWKVVPLSPGQLLDVREEDILYQGLYRKCNSYRGGGGYDQFPMLCEKYLQIPRNFVSQQFIVQLFGCNLDCPYCYVTREGVWGKPVHVTTEQLVSDFKNTGLTVFHLMGGAPALQLKHWSELLIELEVQVPYFVFHSDFLLTESKYKYEILRDISHPRSLYAIDIKGLSKEEWERNTRKVWNEKLFWSNLELMQKARVPSYITFTGIDEKKLPAFWEQASRHVDIKKWKEDAFVINIINYEALSEVDNIAWGKNNCRKSL